MDKIEREAHRLAEEAAEKIRRSLTAVGDSFPAGGVVRGGARSLPLLSERSGETVILRRTAERLGLTG